MVTIQTQDKTEKNNSKSMSQIKRLKIIVEDKRIINLVFILKPNTLYTNKDSKKVLLLVTSYISLETTLSFSSNKLFLLLDVV